MPEEQQSVGTEQSQESLEKHMAENQPNCIIEFRVVDQQRYEIFQRFFTVLQEWSQVQKEIYLQNQTVSASADATQEHRAIAAIDDATRPNRKLPQSSAEWLLHLSPQDAAYLNLPEHSNAIQAIRSWEKLSRRERRKAIKADGNAEDLRRLADFSDMVDYWQEIEFELIDCTKPAKDSAIIRYASFQYPFKGKIALEETLMFFGFFSVINNTC